MDILSSFRLLSSSFLPLVSFDAMQDESYPIAGIKVSNFVLPLYFTSGDEPGGRNDFLGTIHRGKTLVVQGQPRRVWR